MAAGVRRPRACRYDYISTQDVAKDANLNAKYDVIIFRARRAATAQASSQGMPMYGNPMPWKNTPQTPNIGKIDETDDMRPGLGWKGLANLQQFVRRGGLLITRDGHGGFRRDLRLHARASSITAATRLKMIGSVLGAKIVDAASPIAYGYDDSFSIYGDIGPIFGVSNMVGGGGGRGGGERRRRRRPPDRTRHARRSRRGRRAGRSPRPRRREPRVRAVAGGADSPTSSCATASTSSRPTQRPRVIAALGRLARPARLRAARRRHRDRAAAGGRRRAARQGARACCSRTTRSGAAQTRGSYFLVFNAILNFDHLDAGRKLDSR